MTICGESFEHLKLKPNFRHTIIGALFACLILFTQTKFSYFSDTSTLVAISLFNILFVCLLFPLEGPLFCKIVLLLVGNAVGLLWFLIGFAIQENSFFFLNTTVFNAITVLVKPIIDFVWVVSIWSISLSVLAATKSQRRQTND